MLAALAWPQAQLDLFHAFSLPFQGLLDDTEALEEKDAETMRLRQMLLAAEAPHRRHCGTRDYGQTCECGVSAELGSRR